MSDPRISREQVRHVARLARLDLDETELDRMTLELGAILSYVALLAELDTARVQPTSHVGAETSALRHDVPEPGVDHADAMKQSPSSAHGGFAVPAFVDD